MASLAQLPQILQTLLTTATDAAGEASCLGKRPDRAKLTGRTWTQTLVWGWLAHPDATLEQLSQTASRLGVEVTPQSLDQRCDARAADCLRVLAAAVTEVVTADPVALPLLQRFPAVVVQDTTTITLPDALVAVWPSCGGRTPTMPHAALTCGVQLDRCTGALHGPFLASGRTHDQALPWPSAALPPGSLRLADLGFFDLHDLAALDAAGVYWRSKLRVGTVLTTAEGQRWEVLRADATEPNGLFTSPLVVPLSSPLGS
ncbi:MAG TPA: IS4/IS5 family transposase [Herpetosiphonaceae bacterium]